MVEKILYYQLPLNIILVNVQVGRGGRLKITDIQFSSSHYDITNQGIDIIWI